MSDASSHTHGDTSHHTVALLTELLAITEKDNKACAVCIAIDLFRQVLIATTTSRVMHPVAIGGFLQQLCNDILEDLDVPYNAIMFLEPQGDGDAPANPLHS